MIGSVWWAIVSYEGPTLTLPDTWFFLILLSPFIVGSKILAWHCLTKGLGIAIPFGRTLEACFLSILGKYIPGKVFFVVGRLQAYGLKGEQLKLGSCGMLIEFSVENLAGALLLAFALWAGYFTNSSPLVLWAMALLVLALGLLTPWILKQSHLLHRRLAFTLPPSAGVGALILTPLIWTMVHWVFYLGSIYLWLGEHLELSPWTLLAVGAVLGFSSTLGTLAFITPGGLGVREGLATLGFTALGLQWQQGLSLAFAARCLQWASELLCGVFWLSFCRTKKITQDVG